MVPPNQSLQAKVLLFTKATLNLLSVTIVPSVGEQVRQIYNHLQKPGNLAVVTQEWDMLVALLHCNLSLATEIALKLLINITAEGLTV